MNILDLREYRDSEEYKLSEKFNLVTIRPNFPGSDKRNIYSNFVSIIGLVEILKYVDVKEFYSSYSEEGLIFYLQCTEDVTRLKKIAIAFERWFQIGRLLDIDIRNREGEISRSNLNYAKRKCFLCDNRAHYCVRNMTHAVSDIEDFFRKEVIKYLYEGKRNEIFYKFFIFASSVEFYKRLVYIEDDYWKVGKNFIEIEYLTRVMKIANVFKDNNLDLKDRRNYNKVYKELEEIFDPVTFIEKEHVHMIMHLYSNYSENTNISFKELFNSAVDISDVIVIAESIKERSNIRNGLYSVVDIIVKDRRSLGISDEDCRKLIEMRDRKDIESIRKFVYTRDGLFYYTYSLSIFSLILLLMENTKKEVYEFGY